MQTQQQDTLFSITRAIAIYCHAAVGPRHNWSPGRSAANYAAVDAWSPGRSMAAMDGPLCRKWSPGSKPEKQ